MKKQIVIIILCFINIEILSLQCDGKISGIEPKSYKVNGIVFGRGADTSESGWISMQAIVPFRNDTISIFHLTKTDSIIGFDTVMTDSTGNFSASITFERIGIVLGKSDIYSFPYNIINNIHFFNVLKIIDYDELGVDSVFICDTVISPW